MKSGNNIEPDGSQKAKPMGPKSNWENKSKTHAKSLGAKKQKGWVKKTICLSFALFLLILFLFVLLFALILLFVVLCFCLFFCFFLHVGTICAVFRCHVGRCFFLHWLALFALVGVFLSPLCLLCFRVSESIGFGLVGGKNII